MSQRLGIAAALLGDPGTLLFDEPVNGLDPEGVLWIRTLLRGLAAEGRTILVSSHLMSEMEETADHVLVIGRGRLLADTSIAEFTQAQLEEPRARGLPGRREDHAAPARSPGSAVTSNGDGSLVVDRHGGGRRSATSPRRTACACTS